MTDFIVKPSKYHPFIIANSKEGTVLISGISIPESPESFYMPILSWVNDYLNNESSSLEIKFEMQYFNNSTSKYFFKLLRVLDDYQKKGKKIKVSWCYYPEDTDIMEEGEDFSQFFSFPFEVKEQELPKYFSKKKTKNSPLVYYDQSGDIVIEGNSTDLKPWDYFYPLIKWIDTLRINSKPSSIKADIFLNKISKQNTYYIKHIINELELVEAIDGNEVEVTWKYSSDEIKNIGVEYLHNLKLKHILQFV